MGRRGCVVTQGAVGLVRQSGKRARGSGGLASWGLGSWEQPTTDDGVLRPQPGEHEEQPHQGDEYEFVEK